MVKTSAIFIGEDLLLLLLYNVKIDNKQLFFPSVKGNSLVPNIKTLKAFLGNDFCTGLLFSRAFTVGNTTSRVFSVGKTSVFREISSSGSVLRSCSQIFCTPYKDHIDIESTVWRQYLKGVCWILHHHRGIVTFSAGCRKYIRHTRAVAAHNLGYKHHSRRTYL